MPQFMGGVGENIIEAGSFELAGIFVVGKLLIFTCSAHSQAFSDQLNLYAQAKLDFPCEYTKHKRNESARLHHAASSGHGCGVTGECSE